MPIHSETKSRRTSAPLLTIVAVIIFCPPLLLVPSAILSDHPLEITTTRYTIRAGRTSNVTAEFGAWAWPASWNPTPSAYANRWVSPISLNAAKSIEGETRRTWGLTFGSWCYEVELRIVEPLPDDAYAVML